MNSKFLIDEQTKKDIQLTSTLGNSVFDFFNNTVTEGGDRLLKDLFFSPTTNLEEIKARQIKIKRLLPFTDFSFKFDKLILKDLERFWASRANIPSFFSSINIFRISSPEYFYTKRSIIETVDVLYNFHDFLGMVLEKERSNDIEEFYDMSCSCLRKIFKTGSFKKDLLKINLYNIDKYDYVIREELSDQLNSILGFLYEIDACLAIARVAKSRAFCFPTVVEKGQTGEVKMVGLYNLFHRSPIANDISLSQNKKIWFLTGANMAGKSSIIKSISIALYLAHIGLPVPALSMQTDVIDGLFTSINLDDNIDLGYSHFFNEAIRLKEIIDLLPKDSNALIILDELFKGTNNEDASQAIFEVVKYFIKIDGPFTIISSHIAELSECLEPLDNIKCMRLNIDKDSEGMPLFTYKISEGVSHEKLGMWLLEKSGVFNSFNGLLKQSKEISI